MARTIRGRTACYDNVASGSAMGTERTINGAAPPAEQSKWLDNLSAGNAPPTANIADDISAGVVTLAIELV